MEPTWRLRHALCAGLLLSGTQGCVASEAPLAASPTSETPASTATASVDPQQAPSDATSTAAPDPGQPVTAACLVRERRAAAATEFRVQLAFDDLMRSTNGVSRDAAQRVAAQVDRAETVVLEDCDRPSATMRTFLRVARQRSSDAFTSNDLDAMMSAYSRWARSVGVPGVTRRLTNALEACRTLNGRVQVSYRTWWRWSGTGREWWIELTFHSGLRRAWTATLSGRVRATHLNGRSTSSTGKDSGASVVQWGASSYDYATVSPGTSHYLVVLDANDPYVATGPTGTFRVEDVQVSTESGMGSWWCSLPVPERP